MNKNVNNVIINCFKKTSKNIKDYIPPNIKPENIRERIPLKFPDTMESNYTVDLRPNLLFEEWPSDEEVKNFDFLGKNIKFTDSNNNLIVLPYGLRKETFSSMLWMRPDEYVKNKEAIIKIKENFPEKNHNYINNKFALANKNILNFNEYNRCKSLENNKSNKEQDQEEEEQNQSNKKQEIESNESVDGEEKDKANVEKVEEKNKIKYFSSIRNFKIKIKRRNSIDIGLANGFGSLFSKEFFDSKLNNKEKEIFITCQNQQHNFYVVKSELDNQTEQEEKNNLLNDNIKIKEKIKDKEKVKDNNTPKYINKLIPSSLSFGIALSDYCRWVSSQFQLLLDNKICTENNPDNFLRRIYPQDSFGNPFYNPSGRYWIKLYHMGKERKIEIDDRFPFNKNNYECFLPQCLSQYELWPMLLSKALIKLYSYKYRSDDYEYNEVGDSSIIYSLTKFIGIQLPKYQFLNFINQKTADKNNEDTNNNAKRRKVNEISLKHSKNFDYDLIIAFYNSNNFKNNEENKKNKEEKEDNAKSENINIKNYNNKMYQRKLPLIKTSYIDKYTETYIKIKEKNFFKSKKNKMQYNEKIQEKKQKISENKIKNFNFNDYAISSLYDFEKDQKKYLFKHRFETGENPYKKYQKLIIKKSNKLLSNGIMPNVGYSLLEFFKSQYFNMKRIKPFQFSDLKLNLDYKYKQMTPSEKLEYLSKLKDLKIVQKKEKKKRINEYFDEGESILFIKFYNGSFIDINGKTKLFERNTLFNPREIQIVKFCLKNNLPFPPEKYFQNTFLEKVKKDEETGEINFWTKNFYKNLIERYFSEKYNKISKKQGRDINCEAYYLNDEDENENNKIIENKSDNSIEIENKKTPFDKYMEQSSILGDIFENEVNSDIPGAWLNYDLFSESFNEFIVFKNSGSFKNVLNIDNIWYNYDKDFFEENKPVNIIHLIKEGEESNENNNNDNNIIISNNIFNESELYLLFESNGEKNYKSVSSEMNYEMTQLTNVGNKFDDIHYFISLIIYEVLEEGKIKKIKTFNIKGYHSSLSLNISDIANNNSSTEFFIIIQRSICPFGYYLRFFSNKYNMENYSYNQFLCMYENFIEKKNALIHPALAKEQYFLISHILIELKKDEKTNIEENQNNISKNYKFYINISEYENNYIKSNMNLFLINNKTKKEVRIYTNKMFEIDFSKSQKYIIEFSIIPPENIVEKIFDFLILYNNPEISINFFENIEPFYIIEKYIPNKHFVVFDELIFPSDLVLATMEISLEYRPNSVINQRNEESKESPSLSKENLPEVKKLPFDVSLTLFFFCEEELLIQKNFTNKSIFMNLELNGNIINPKLQVNENKNKSYVLKCVLDPNDCPNYLKDISSYKGDIYWRIGIFSTDPLYFSKNTIQEDKERSLKESWEIHEPGRGTKASTSRQKYLSRSKHIKGENLIKEEKNIYNNIIPQKEVSENNCKTILTNVPPKDQRKLIKLGEIKKSFNTIEEQLNPEKNNTTEKHDKMKKLPKIQIYYSNLMKNFYLYSKKQNRIITKRKNFSNDNDSLPNFIENCKTPEQRDNEKRKLEEKYHQFYSGYQTIEQERKLKRNIFNNEIKNIIKRNLTKRQKLQKATSYIDKNLINIIIKNNQNVSKMNEIRNLFNMIFDKSKNENINNIINDEILFQWYNEYKAINNSINNSKSEIKMNKKYEEMIKQIKQKLSDYIKNKIEEELKIGKKEKKNINEKIKKYFQIIKENLLDSDKLNNLLTKINT